ncbi:MAG: protein kinase [Lentisphaerales bacterium]|nr:protein kinase [Lentisphaerales bacterium]
MAYYCTQCNAANLIDYHNGEFFGSCFNCGSPIHLQQTDSLCINTIIGERYQIRELLEETGINNLYLATDLVTSNLVILRVFCWDFSYSISDPEDFLNTVDSVGGIAAPTHVEIVDWGINEDLIFTVWPCENIETLTRLLKHHTNFEPEVALSICREIAIALENIYFETGVGHYNLSADVIYLDGQGNTRFSDAGHAAYLFYDEHFQDAEFNIFNAHYVSPEITFNWSFPDIRSDMYSLGCCLYAMVTGKLPFGHRGPQNEADYTNFSLTKPDELRLGDTFCQIFYGMTEVNPDDRYESWHDVIKHMDNYFHEDKMQRKSSMSGKRRSLTISYNFDVFTDIDETLVKKARSKKRQKKKKALSSSDIRVRMRSESPISKIRTRSGKSVRKKNRKNDNTTLLTVASVIAVLGVLLFAILASKLSGVNSENFAAVKKENKEVTSKQSTELKTAVKSKTQKNKKTQAASTLDTATIPLTAEDEFKELTFEVREFTMRKEWDKALTLCELYDGPYNTQVTKLRAEIEKKRMSYLQVQLDKSRVKEPAGVTDQPLGEHGSLKEMVDKIYKGQYTEALTMLPYVENTEKMNLSLEKASLEDLGPERLKNLIGRGYEMEVGREITLNVEGNDFKGTLQQVSIINGSLKIKVNYLSRKLERIYSFNLINPQDNLKRIVKSDQVEQAFTRFLFLLKKKLYDQALDSLSKYDGSLKEALTTAMQDIQNDKAQTKWLELVSFLSLQNGLDDNKFVESFKSIHLVGGDAWVAKWLMNDFIKKYGLSSFYEQKKSRISLLQSFLSNYSSSSKEPSLIVSADGRPGTTSFLKAVKEVESGGLIRLLPGEYSGNLIINRKMQIIGATGVSYNGNMSLDEDHIDLSHIHFKEGYVELHRKVRNVQLDWLFFDKSGMKLRGENSFVTIANCLVRGLNLTTCRKINITDSVLLDSDDSDANNRYAINGFLSGSLTNSIIYSQDGYAMKMHDKMDSTLLVKYCLFYGKKGLVFKNKDKLSILDENNFNREVGRLVNSELVVPQFVGAQYGNYKLKDFTPGFFTGEDKKAIGIQFSYKIQK